MISLWQSQQGMAREINQTVAQALMLMLADIFPLLLFLCRGFIVIHCQPHR